MSVVYMLSIIMKETTKELAEEEEEWEMEFSRESFWCKNQALSLLNYVTGMQFLSWKTTSFTVGEGFQK